jgi:RHS repeat-associated protein
MMNSMCYINLNARLYDPTIARVPTPDPTIPDSVDGQALNRYSYVANRPLNSIDPSGLTPEIACVGTGNHKHCYQVDTGSRVGDPSQTVWTGGLDNLIYLALGGLGGSGLIASLGPGIVVYGGGTSSSDDASPVETVIVNCSCYWVQFWDYSDDAFDFFGMGGGDSDTTVENPWYKAKVCSQGTLNDMGTVRQVAFVGTAAGLMGVGVGVWTEADTLGAGSLPAGGIALASAGVVSVSGYADLAASGVEGYETGNYSDFKTGLVWAGIGGIGGSSILPPLGSVLFSGAATAFATALGGVPYTKSCLH